VPANLQDYLDLRERIFPKGADGAQLQSAAAAQLGLSLRQIHTVLHG
jgi:hypothetical protein